MATVSITEEEAAAVFASCEEGDVVLDKLYRKMSAALTNESMKSMRMVTAGERVSYRDVKGPL